MSISDPYLTNTDLNMHLRDARHSHQLYTEHNFAFSPKNKFLYHVLFQPNVGADAVGSTADSNSLLYQKEIGVLAKIVDLPQYRASIETKQQYNRKKNLQTRIDYQDVTIKFHDDATGVTRALLQEYYNYYFADGRPHSATEAKYQTRDKYRANGLYRYGLDNDTTKPFFDYIKIYQLSRRKWFSYKLINPIISQWGHDTLDNSDSAGIMENTIVLAYEGVYYDHGDIDGSEPTGFTTNETRYDNVSSPMGYPAGSASGFNQQGPVLIDGENMTPGASLPRMSNGASVSPSPLRQLGEQRSSVIPGYIIPTQDNNNIRVVQSVGLQSYTAPVASSDTLLQNLSSNPSADASFTARALNSGSIPGVSYDEYLNLPGPAQEAVKTDLLSGIKSGAKKLAAMAQDAINSAKGN